MKDQIQGSLVLEFKKRIIIFLNKKFLKMTVLLRRRHRELIELDPRTNKLKPGCNHYHQDY